MPKLSSLKDLFGLVSNINAAWPTIVLVGGLAVSFLLSVPPGALVAIGVAVVLAALLVTYKLRHRFLYVPLLVAARTAYEQLEETVWSEAARRMHDEPSPQRTLDYMGQLLINDIALYGSRPPSTVFNKIDAKLVKRSAVEGNCTMLRSNDPKELPWTNLAVERKALKRRVKDMKARDLPAPHEKEPGVIQIALPSVEEQRRMVQAAKTSEPEDDEAFEILNGMAKSTDGMLLVVRLLEGTNFQIDQENVNSSFDTRELAFLRDAVERLERDRLIRSVNRTSNLDLYEITALGYKQVERAKV